MTHKEQTEIRLVITVRQGVTVLPRCLQILSRRGFTLVSLSTSAYEDGTATLMMDVVGEPRRYSTPHEQVSRCGAGGSGAIPCMTPCGVRYSLGCTT
jgi:acetolactate synthase regulatory subunit